MWLNHSVGSGTLARLGLAIFCFTATSCSPVPPPSERETIQETAAYTEEEKRIAGALSLGSTALLDNDRTPLQRALDCSSALDFLAIRLDSAGILNPEQRRVFESIINFYRSEVERLELEFEPDQNPGAISAERPQAQDMTGKQKAQLGMACLRQGAEFIS